VLPSGPAQEKEDWALRSLGVQSWDEAATAQEGERSQVQPWAEVGTGQSLANIQTRMSDWWFNELSNGWRQY